MNAGNGNPKDFVGASKAPLSTISRRVMHELGLAMLEGECKYWRHNYRAAPVRAMVYLDALDRHLSAWIEGQEIDPDSGLSHLVKAMACLAIIRDAQLYGALIDDRPPAQANQNWMAELNEIAKGIIERTSQYVRGAYTEANRGKWAQFSAALSKGPIRTGAIREALLPPPLYVPKAGERVRVVEIAPFDAEPFHVVGATYVAERSYPGSDDPAHPSHNWILMTTIGSAGTWCRVEPV